MTSYYVTSDWKTLVPEGDERAAYGVQARDLKRLGLLDQADGETGVPDAPEPEVMQSANLIPEDPEPEAEPEPEAKEAPTPPNKARKRPASK